MLTTIMSSYGINFVKKYLLVWLPFLLTFQISCVHRILKRVIDNFTFDFIRRDVPSAVEDGALLAPDAGPAQTAAAAGPRVAVLLRVGERAAR